MGWYENQKARNEAAKAERREGRQRRAEQRDAPAPTWTPDLMPPAPQAAQETAPPAARPAGPAPTRVTITPPTFEPAVQQQMARSMNRMEKVLRLEQWALGVQLVLLLIPTLFILAIIGWVVWEVVF